MANKTATQPWISVRELVNETDVVWIVWIVKETDVENKGENGEEEVSNK